MKKLLLLLLSVGMTMAFSSCDIVLGYIDQLGTGLTGSAVETSSKDKDEDEEKTYTITFQQYGQPDVVKEVKGGETLTDIPTPKDRTGYTVVWETKDLSNVQGDLIVKAIETANTYTITYDAGEGTVDPAQEEVVYDDTVELAVPERDGYEFTGWTYEGKAVLDGKWTIADNVTLVADWTANPAENITVTFIQNGVELYKVQVAKNGSLSEEQYRSPQKKTGYNVVWDKTLEELTDLTENVTVTAIETVKSWSVTLNANGGTLSTTTITVTYGREYTLPTPAFVETETNTTHTFEGWTYGDTEIAEKGTWNLDEESETIELVASWSTATWTKNY